MSSSNSQNIRIFIGWFGIDSKSKKLEIELATSLRVAFPFDGVSWSEDNTSFWIPEKTIYYKHFCSNGLYFNYPLKINEISGKNDIIILRSEAIRVGKVRGSEERIQDSDWTYYQELAKQDLKEHPVQEEKFDWDLVKREVGDNLF